MHKSRFEPEHMGWHLQAQFLDDYALTPEQFAAAIRLPLGRVKRVLAGQDRIDEDMALRLARLFGGTGDGWLYWQMGYELWRAHERIAEELEAIAPLDPDTRVSVDEPLEPEVVESIRQQLAEIDDPRRWVVMSSFGDEELPLWEMSLSRTFYNVESNCYATQIDGATAFKEPQVAHAVATHLGKDHRITEVTKRDLEKPHQNSAIDRKIRDGLLKTAGHGMKVWDVTTYLHTKADMAAYIEAAAEIGDRELISVAVADVMRALTQQAVAEDAECSDSDDRRALDERFDEGAAEVIGEFDLSKATRPNRDEECQ